MINSEILKYFPEELKEKIVQSKKDNIEEIRIRSLKPVILKNNIDETVLEYIPPENCLLQILQKICDNSIYSYQNQICEGYITIKGGHRIRYYRKYSYKREKCNKYHIYK